LKLTKKIRDNNIRVDIDDRVESVGKRIRDSELEWVPFTLVIGDKESKGLSFVVRDRKNNKEEKMKLDKLINFINSKTENMPFDNLPLPIKISERIKFT
jgi:threonyl-tRNA synthetase